MAETKLLEKVYVGSINGEAVERKSYFPEYGFQVFRSKGEEFLRVTREDMNGLPNNVRDALVAHGLFQKVGDGAVKPSNPERREEYETDPSAYIIDRAMAVYENLQAGTWVERAEGAGERVTILVSALARAGGVTVEAAEEIVKSWDDAKKKRAAKVPEIAKAISDIKAERAAERRRKLDEAVGESDGSGLAALLG